MSAHRSRWMDSDSGSKTFISNGFRCDLVIVVAKTDSAAGAAGVSLIVVRERTAFGKPIFSFQNSKFVLAECDTLVTVGWRFLDDCIEKHLAGELDIATAAKAKWWLTEQQCIVIDRCVQLFGGYGYMAEYPIARMYADSRVQKVYGGANEIMKEIIARTM